MQVTLLEKEKDALWQAFNQQQEGMRRQQEEHDAHVQDLRARLDQASENMRAADRQHQQELHDHTLGAQEQQRRMASEHASAIAELGKRHEAAIRGEGFRARARIEGLEGEVAALNLRYELR
jgi:predicted  nucleic acid-binding Zn-ribbon protein